MGELDKNDLLCSIARSKEQMQRADNWRNTEYKAKCEELRRLQDELDAEITRESQYHRNVAQKLDRIARLKTRIAESTPDNNGFRFEPSRK
jgi:predicted RNase H-like nuclease (RuvC/YqgF family)